MRPVKSSENNSDELKLNNELTTDECQLEVPDQSGLTLRAVASVVDVTHEGQTHFYIRLYLLVR